MERIWVVRLGPAIVFSAGQGFGSIERDAGRLRRAATSGGGAGHRVILRVRGVDALHRDLVGKGLAPTVPRDAEWGERYFEIPDPEGVVISCAELIHSRS